MRVTAAPARETRRDGAELGSTPRREPVTVRALVIGTALVVLHCWWLMVLWGRAGYVTGQSFPAIVSLYYNAVFTLLLLVGLNAVVRCVAPRRALRETELLTIYVMLTVATATAGHDSLEILWPMIAYPAWFATPANRWERFQEHLPEWLTVQEKGRLYPYFLGNSSLYSWENLGLWLPPVLNWALLTIVLGAMMLCMVSLLKQRWIQHERLSYPNVLLPLAMTESHGTLYRRRPMVVGFLIAGVLDLGNGLHHLYPWIPSLGGALTEHDLRAFFPSRPFSAMGWTPLAVYPFAVGMTFFIPLDLSFSIWVFYLVGKATRVVGDVFGATATPQYPFAIEQSAGAWVGLGFVALWGSRRYLLGQAADAWRGRERDPDAPLSPRVAMIGLLLGVLFLLAFCGAAGTRAGWTLAFFGLYFAVSLAITRVRAEVGPPSHDIASHPTMTLVTCVGSERIGMAGLGLFSYFNAFNRAYRSHPMPCMLEGLALATRRNLATRPLVAAMLLATVVATVASAWAFYALAYRYGAAVFGEHGQCRPYFDQLAAWQRDAAPPNATGMAAMGVGASVTFALMALKRAFLWWPFHPTGYALSLGMWNANWFWFSVFVGWAVKAVLMRLGGLNLYRESIPFFMGLILGEFAMGALWGLLGIAMGMPMYRFLP